MLSEPITEVFSTSICVQRLDFLVTMFPDPGFIRLICFEGFALILQHFDYHFPRVVVKGHTNAAERKDAVYGLWRRILEYTAATNEREGRGIARNELLLGKNTGLVS